MAARGGRDFGESRLSSLEPPWEELSLELLFPSNLKSKKAAALHTFDGDDTRPVVLLLCKEGFAFPDANIVNRLDGRGAVGDCDCRLHGGRNGMLLVLTMEGRPPIMDLLPVGPTVEGRVLRGLLISSGVIGQLSFHEDIGRLVRS